MHPGDSIRNPRNPRWHPRCPWRLKIKAKRLQIGPKRCPRVSKLTPRGAQEAPSWVQEMAKSAQGEPKSSPRASKLGEKGFQRALGEQHGGIRRAVEWQNVKTMDFDDPITLLMVFWCLKKALGRPKWSPSGAWRAV